MSGRWHLPTALVVAALSTAVYTQEIGWSANGRDAQGTRYLPAAEITRENVSRLEVGLDLSHGRNRSAFRDQQADGVRSRRRSSSTARCTSARRSAA